MKKFFSYALLFAALGSLSFGVAACSDKEHNTTLQQEQESALKNVTEQYVNHVVYPTYSSLATQTELLFNKLEALRTKLNAGQTVSQTEIDALCQNYKDARKIWEASEAFLYGAASDFEIDPHIDTWPLDVETLAKDLAQKTKMASLNTAYDIKKVRENITSKNLGFHGIEFVLFRNGQNRPASFFNNNTLEDFNFFTGKNVTAKEEIIYAYNVAGDLRDKCYQLEVAWLGDKANAAHIARVKECAALLEDFGTLTKKGLSFGNDLLSAGKQESTHGTFKKVMETIFISGCGNICGEVADQKLGQAYKAITEPGSKHKDEETGEEVENSRDYIESPYSYNSYNDFHDNIMSIQNSLYGNYYGSRPEIHSIMMYLQKYNPTMEKELQSKLTAALTALEACQKSGVAFVQNPVSPLVKTAIDKIGELNDYLEEVSKWILEN